MAPIRLILIDDHRLVHEAVETIIQTQTDIELVAHGDNGAEAIQLCETYQPDVILIDVKMPIMDGANASKIIHERFPNIRILVLSNFDDDTIVHQMLQNGASGYILKNSLLADLVITVRAVHMGNSVFAKPITTKLIYGYEPAPSLDFGLTRREQEVLKYMAEGLSIQEIANILIVSPSTVKFHLNNVLQKMGVATRVEAVVLAVKNNLI